jgi:hypothetical protein
MYCVGSVSDSISNRCLARAWKTKELYNHFIPTFLLW